MFQIELCHHQVDEGDEIRDEDAGSRDTAVVSGHREKEIDAGHGADHSVDCDVVTVVDKSGELPDGEACHQPLRAGNS